MFSLRHGGRKGAGLGAGGFMLERPPPPHALRMTGIRWGLALAAVVSIVALLPQRARAETVVDISSDVRDDRAGALGGDT